MGKTEDGKKPRTGMQMPRNRIAGRDELSPSLYRICFFDLHYGLPERQVAGLVSCHPQASQHLDDNNARPEKVQKRQSHARRMRRHRSYLGKPLGLLYLGVTQTTISSAFQTLTQAKALIGIMAIVGYS
jgi:hypothetical protein